MTQWSISQRRVPLCAFYCEKKGLAPAPASNIPLHKNWVEPRYCILPSQAVQLPKVLLQRKASVELRHPSRPKWSFLEVLKPQLAFRVKPIGASTVSEGNRQWVQLPDIPQLIVQHWEVQEAYGSDVTNNDEYGNGASAIAKPNHSWRIWLL